MLGDRAVMSGKAQDRYSTLTEWKCFVTSVYVD
jgi:hypothetical protein